MTTDQWVYLVYRIDIRHHQEQRRLKALCSKGAPPRKITAQHVLVNTMSELRNKTVEGFTIDPFHDIVKWHFCPDDCHQVFQLRRTLLDDVRRLKYIKDKDGLKVNTEVQCIFEPQYADAQIHSSYV